MESGQTRLPWQPYEYVPEVGTREQRKVLLGFHPGSDPLLPYWFLWSPIQEAVWEWLEKFLIADHKELCQYPFDGHKSGLRVMEAERLYLSELCTQLCSLKCMTFFRPQ